MATHLLFVGLLCLCGVSLSQGCTRELLLNVDFPGSDIKHVFSPSAEHCQYLCTQEAACLFFSFLRPDWTRDNRKFFCYLKYTGSGKPNKQISIEGITSGFSLKSCNLDPTLQVFLPAPCLSQVYHNMDFPGADYRSLFTSDYEECQRVCTHDPACQFFTFIKPAFANQRIRYKCHLKFSWTIPKIPTVIRVNWITSGFSQRLQITQNHHTECEGKLFHATNIPGHDVEVLPAVSPEHCQAYCSAHPQCTHFSYVSHNFRCYLKNNPNEMGFVPEGGVTSGLPGRLCQLDNSWIKKTYEGIDVPHSDIRRRFFLVGEVWTCQRACTEDPNCQYFAYITEKHPDRAWRRRCYLKRVITMPAPPRVTTLANVVSGFTLRNCNTDIV